MELSKRQYEVLQAIANGEVSKTIAARLGLEPISVDGHARAACEKLNATTRSHAVAEALRKGLIK